MICLKSRAWPGLDTIAERPSVTELTRPITRLSFDARCTGCPQPSDLRRTRAKAVGALDSNAVLESLLVSLSACLGREQVLNVSVDT